ncbi:MAG: hypothetical protein A3E37_02200 [Candidatus Andersenbacteria bacterium RIFCSPHIGHO2_12_FULL_46_9]|nr:MAG: hypothetical protein UW94_C0011G0064 [Parcubacteria group bacterium GW2011_GWA2_45_14]OGY34605.1 MAG: hypothetical protein A3B76_06485 [Candidatus Andersenbacteria bacterium RIFCSPHIGHO2_02_FULL_46_16]OGY37612.1 MAG: hypothetical protein A3E37_02200 [Candidatus Andersenbacteria bacterium RIFCSPHIGHO2_12_FULL_46_9]OGY37892.1 MAG: hypothetical protein A3I08_01745 [Candidatus Andersenbacteria bacterium RIFCSPLOWO2_02_FULL_46_11]OGY40430.1 MAG: hypothetical protein A3G57_01265 [Candidatus A
MTRYIGIRHRRKRTKEGEARPTTVAIAEGGQMVTFDLESDTAELDFLMRRFPIAWRKVRDDEEIMYFTEESTEGVRVRHCKFRKAKEDESVMSLHSSHVLQIPDPKSGKAVTIVTQIPVAYEGLQSGDMVGMVLGGSGDRYASALSRRGEEIGAEVYRLPPFSLADKRGDATKDDDHLLIASLLQRERSLFYLVRRRDRDMIRTKEALSLRMSAMKSRIACGQRLEQRMVGKIFLNEEGYFPEGVIEDLAAAELANDAIYGGNVAEERRYERELGKLVKKMALWDLLFADIVGFGPRLTAGLIVPISDIRRFWVDPAQMEEMYQRSRILEQEGDFTEDRQQVADQIKEGMGRCEVLGLVARWQDANGKSKQAWLLKKASLCHRERGRLLSKGQAKLRKFCGVHVNSFDKHGQALPRNLQFPRRRVGEVFNSSGMARQTLWLLGDQFNRHPESDWGLRLLQIKEKMREKHPEVVEEEATEEVNGVKKKVMKQRFTAGHIQKMSLWRARSKFVDHLFMEWTRIEEEEERQRRAEVEGINTAEV